MRRSDPADPTTGLTLQEIQNLRHEVTTDSWSLPCPAVPLLKNASGTGTTNVTHISELLTDPNGQGVSPDQIYNLLSPDLLAGLRMDLNRVFGNGEDDINNPNDVVDEPGEYDTEVVRQCNAAGNQILDTSSALIPLDLDNDGTPGDAGDARARQLYARHLYVLAMAVVNVEGIKSTLTGTPAEKDAEASRMIAQWAVNVVDFRDRDSIMTGFEYDVYPFAAQNPSDNPWGVNDNLIDDEVDVPDVLVRGLVWGCERPELLITETLAFHDRRTEDLDDGGGTAGSGDTGGNFDQRVRPEGSLFVELYNPWSISESLPVELYEKDVHGNEGVH